MWAAYFQVDGEMRYTIAVKKFKGAAEQKVDDFISRMSHPEVGVWFTWVEECDANVRDSDDLV